MALAAQLLAEGRITSFILIRALVLFVDDRYALHILALSQGDFLPQIDWLCHYLLD